MAKIREFDQKSLVDVTECLQEMKTMGDRFWDSKWIENQLKLGHAIVEIITGILHFKWNTVFRKLTSHRELA